MFVNEDFPMEKLHHASGDGRLWAADKTTQCTEGQLILMRSKVATSFHNAVVQYNSYL